MKAIEVSIHHEHQFVDLTRELNLKVAKLKLCPAGKMLYVIMPPFSQNAFLSWGANSHYNQHWMGNMQCVFQTYFLWT